MKSSSVQKWLESEIDNYPEKTSQVDYYSFVKKLCNKIVREDRTEFVRILEGWISLRDKRRSMLAIRLAADYKIIEVINNISSLLSEVESGKLWLSYYSAQIDKHLKKLEEP